MIHYGLAERGDAPKPPNQAFTQWKDHRGGWVILVVRLSYPSCPSNAQHARVMLNHIDHAVDMPTCRDKPIKLCMLM
jgi:hypothetical protein